MKKKSFKKVRVIIAFFALTCMSAFGQSLTHPHIWVDDADKQVILDKINLYPWAGNLFNQYKSRVDPQKVAHKQNPATLLSTIPDFPGDQKTHREVLTLGYEAALLYWLTGDNDYGQLAADILAHYATKISAITGTVHFTTGTSYSHLVDTREAYTKPPMIYDFVYAYLKKSTTKVYNLSNGTKSAFNFTKAQNTFIKLADGVFNEGSINSNHPILEAPGALFNLLCIDDDTTRSTYMNKFMVGTPNQNGLTWMMDECKKSTVWPEATGYSIGPHRIILELMNVVDRYNSSLNVVGSNKDLVKNAFLFENYKFPNKTNVMRFGDAHRDRLNTIAIMERVLVISKRKSYGILEGDAKEMLETLYADNGGYNPQVFTQSLEWNNPYYLLWGEDISTINFTPIDYKRSINIDYAGIAMQRNNNTTEDISEYGLMGYTGGAHYVHSHLTGIDMEIYGSGAVLGTGGGDVGAANREDEVFRNYHRIYAGHNTVIVNGSSKGEGKGAWKSDNQLLQSATKTIAAEPSSLQAPISNEFSFSAQLLDDEINNAKQQRDFSVIRTGAKTGYYFDLFRSKSLGTNNYHDYVYHNVGDGVTLVDDNDNSIALSAKTSRYNSIRSDYGGKFVMFPGWHYFEDVKTSDKTTSAIKATIAMTKVGTRYMHMLMPGGQNREYTTCKGPETIEAQVGYEGVKTPVVTVRHYGEAWTKPFISVFEPSRNQNGSVQSVENLLTATKIVGAKVVSVVDGVTITDYIISNENATDTYTSADGKISFKGRFGIIRTKPVNGTTTVSLYIGEGETLSYGSLSLAAGAEKKGLLVADDPDVSEINAQLTAPANNSTFILGNPITLKADAAGGSGIAKVNFRVNGSFLKTDTSAPYETTWEPTSAGAYTIDLAVYDNDNVKFTSQEITVNIVEQAVFTAEVTAPVNNSTFNLGEAITIIADASTNAGSIVKVNFKIDGSYFSQDTSAPFEKVWTPTAAGTYAINVAAYDNNNVKIESSSVHVTVVDPLDDLSGVYRLKNLATGRYMDSNGASVVVGTDTYSLDRQWRLVKVNDMQYNIDCEFDGRGCLGSDGLGVVINSTIESPTTISDKVWKAISLGNNVFRFENMVDGRGYLSANTSDYTVGSSSSTQDDTKWELEYVSALKVASLPSSIDSDQEAVVGVSIYPNPTSSNFTIDLQGFKQASICLYNLSGALVLQIPAVESSVQLSKSDVLTPGVYLVKVIGENAKTAHCKLMIK